MKSKNLLIVGATSGIMVSCLEKFLKEKYTIFATYNNKESLFNIPKKLRNSKNIKFHIKLKSHAKFHENQSTRKNVAL